MITDLSKEDLYKQPMRRFFQLFKSSQFIGLTLMGNSFIFLLSALFYYVEVDENYLVTTWLDSLWFSFATVTTVGYGDIVPVTDAGKVIGMFSMLIGTGLFATYTALFANALLGREFKKMDRKMRIIKKNVDGLKEDFTEEEEELLTVIENLKVQIERLENKINK
jgi:voltage-gated potassium channel